MTHVERNAHVAFSCAAGGSELSGHRARYPVKRGVWTISLRKRVITDLVIVAGMQRIEHYEISAYGTNIALADAPGEKEVSALLMETLEEEKQTDLSLTKITRQSIMNEAMGGPEAGSSKRGQNRGRMAAE